MDIVGTAVRGQQEQRCSGGKFSSPPAVQLQ